MEVVGQKKLWLQDDCGISPATRKSSSSLRTVQTKVSLDLRLNSQAQPMSVCSEAQPLDCVNTSTPPCLCLGSTSRSLHQQPTQQRFSILKNQRWLRGEEQLLLFWRTQVQFPAPISGSCQPSVTVTPGYPNPVLAWTCSCTHMAGTQTHEYTHKTTKWL